MSQATFGLQGTPDFAPKLVGAGKVLLIVQKIQYPHRSGEKFSELFLLSLS